MKLPLATLLLASLPIASARSQIDHHGGGMSQLPNGEWQIRSHAPDTDEVLTATAWLRWPGVPKRRLLDYTVPSARHALTLIASRFVPLPQAGEGGSRLHT